MVRYFDLRMCTDTLAISHRIGIFLYHFHFNRILSWLEQKPGPRTWNLVDGTTYSR
jgi:hypothetical protein